MMMPFIDLAAQQARIRSQIDAAMARVLEHGQYIMGPEVTELEHELAKYVGSQHCLSCSSGTDALLMALMAWEVGPGCAVFTTPFTFVSSAEAIVLTGATPVFADIDPVTFNIYPDSLDAAIEAVVADGTLCPTTIMPVDLFGQPCDYARLRALANRHDLRILQDAAQAFGATDADGRRCPTQGTIGATSFFPAKPLGCYGDGGAVFTDDVQLAERMASIRLHGKGKEPYATEHIGLNARMDTLQAAILLEKLNIYSDEIEKRQQVASWYAQYLDGIADLVVPDVVDGMTSVWAQYTVRHPRRTRVQTALKAAGIPTAIYYPRPIHQSPAYAETSLCPVSLAVAEAASQEVFSLPFHPYLSEADCERIAGVIRSAN